MIESDRESPRERLATEDTGALAGGKFAPGSGLEPAEIELADADADEAERGVSDAGGHFADLVVFSLHEREGNPAVGNVFAKANRRVARRHEGLR